MLLPAHGGHSPLLSLPLDTWAAYQLMLLPVMMEFCHCQDVLLNTWAAYQLMLLPARGGLVEAEFVAGPAGERLQGPGGIAAMHGCIAAQVLGHGLFQQRHPARAIHRPRVQQLAIRSIAGQPAKSIHLCSTLQNNRSSSAIQYNLYIISIKIRLVPACADLKASASPSSKALVSLCPPHLH